MFNRSIRRPTKELNIAPKMRCDFHKISIEKRQKNEIGVNIEIYRESEVEDELERELPKLLEEKVAEDNEA